MSRDCTKIIVLSIILFPALSVQAGAGECRRYVGARTIECYNCDSRFDQHCEKIDENNPNSIKPYSKLCQGCCVKFVHKLASGENYVHRMCTEHIIINYFMVDHVCMSEGKGRGKMCFCEEHLCNGISPTKLVNNYSGILLLFVTTTLSKIIS